MTRHDSGLRDGLWILSYPRTGSYFLASALNATGVKPPIQERYHLRRLKEVGPCPKYNKVHPDQFWSRNIPFSKVLEQVPGCQFVVTRRKDLVACAVSFYLAIVTKQWQVRSEADAKKLNEHSEINWHLADLTELYHRFFLFDNYWRAVLKEYGCDYFEVIYEDLFDAPENVMSQLLDYLGNDCDAASLLANVTHQKQAGLRPEYELMHAELRAVLQRQPTSSSNIRPRDTF